MQASSTLVGFAIVVAMLYFGQDILQPLALAVLLAFALAPLVVRLRRLRVPSIPAVLTVVLVATLTLAGLATLVASQLVTLANDLPSYQDNLRQKIQSSRDAIPSGGALDRLTSAVRDLGREIDEAAQNQAQQPVGQSLPTGEIGVQRPIPVEIHARPPSAFETLRSVVGPLLQPLVTAGLIIVFVVFMLIERTELRDRLIRLIDERDLTRATKAIDDAARRVSRYLLMQLLIAMAHGIPYGVGLWLIGVPSPLLWGLLATVLRFIPYVGPVFAAVCPLALALAVDPGWSMVLATLALIVALELFTNNVLEPWLYGSITGLSPVAILVAAVFWTTLWGPLGLLLSVPLTVCVVVLGRHIPQVAFLDLLLGDRPALSLHERIYQRLLAGDRHEAAELAEAFEAEHGALNLADDLLIPVLRLAEQDRDRRALEPALQERLAVMVEEIGSLLGDTEPEGYDPPGATRPRARVLCIGGRNALDVAGAVALGRSLEAAGLDTRVVAEMALRPGEIVGAGEEPPGLVCIAYLSPPSLPHVRRVVRRLRAVLPHRVPVIACCFLGAVPLPEVDASVGTGRDVVREARARLGLPPLVNEPLVSDQLGAARPAAA